MAKIIPKQSIKKNLLLIFYVLFSVFFSENILSKKFCAKENVSIALDDEMKCIEIDAIVYDYKDISRYGHACLHWCKFEASANGYNYHILMNLYTNKQPEKFITSFILANKLKYAQIQFIHTHMPLSGTIWHDDIEKLDVKVNNIEKLASVSLRWHLDRRFKDIRYIKISGVWQISYPYQDESFHNVVYEIKSPRQTQLKLNNPGINAKVSKNNTINMFSEAEEIVIQGADLGSEIKVFTTSGVELKSVISNNDLVKIKVPAKQIYLVHIGKSRYKVIL